MREGDESDEKLFLPCLSIFFHFPIFSFHRKFLVNVYYQTMTFLDGIVNYGGTNKSPPKGLYKRTRKSFFCRNDFSHLLATLVKMSA